jgi:mannitol-1-/sugar-/sorbitol-6-phosphatase
MDLSVDAILFDLDGTLIDSTPCVDRCWRALAERIGVDFDSLRGTYHGVPARQTLARIMPDASDEEREEAFRWIEAEEIADTDGIVVLPGAADALGALPLDRWAIVTSGTQALARARILAAGLPEPKLLVTADDVSVGKPAPDPYLLAARLLGVEPRRCLVVEDAPAGVAAGLASGATVLGIATTHQELGVPTVNSLADVSISSVDGTVKIELAVPAAAGRR